MVLQIRDAMNIFLINHYAGSLEMGMEFRPYYLAREWVKMGHSVTILAANYSHIRKVNPEMTEDMRTDMLDGIRYIWINTPAYEGNGIGRIRNMLAFISKTLYKVSYFVETYQPDVVIASSTYPSDNYVARKMARLSGAKYIYEVHDLWPLSPMELGGMSKYHPFIIAMQHAESFAYRKADAVVSMLPNTREYMVAHGLSPDKWHHIPNGIRIEEPATTTTALSDYANIFEELKLAGKTIVGYAGGHAISNSLHTIVEAAGLMQSNDKVQFVLIGNGQEKQNLIEQAKGLKNILFLDPVSKTRIQGTLTRMDILLITWNKSPLYRFGISPNKIFDYMMAAKPIIHATDAPNTFVEEADCGIAVEPENPKAIVEAVNKLTAMPEEELKRMGENGRKYVVRNHDYKVLAKRFVEIIRSL